MDQIDKFPLTSMDITEEQKQKLKQLFPEVFTEGDKIDWDKLRLSLGENVDVGKERFGMNWPGKADCFKIIQQPSLATLIPARDESVNFDTTENLFIEGDNLEVLKLLQKSYLGKIKMIYIDPPYNTGNEFLYPDNYSETLETYLAYTGQVDSEGKKFSTNTDTEGRFHSKWMNMMYPRLFLAKNLLREDGVFFISIDDNEIDNLKKICDELFGEENRIATFIRLMKTGGQKGKHFSPNKEYILIYGKHKEQVGEFRDEMDEKLIKKVYTQIETEGNKKGQKYRTMGLYQSSLDIRPNQRYFIQCPDGSLVIPPGKSLPNQKTEGEKVKPIRGDGVWRWTYETYLAEKKNDKIKFIETKNGVLINENGELSKWNVYTKIYLNDRIQEGKVPTEIIAKFENRLSSKELQELGIPFDFAKPKDLLKHLIKMIKCGERDIILDFFAGSGTIAHSVLSQNFDDGHNRRFICAQLPEPTEENSEAFKEGFKTIADICKERIRRVIKKIKEEQKQNADMFSKDNPQLDLGFKVFKLAPSNFSSWNANVDKTAEAIGKQLELHINHISESADQEAILYELLLKSGFELTTMMEKLEIEGKTVFSIGEGELLICLERELTNELIKAMAERKPVRAICLDEGFQNNDQLKTNAALIMKNKGVVKFQTV